MIWYAFVDPGFSWRLCLTLLHSVWQMALFALVAWCVERLWRKRSVERRYFVNVVALFAILAAMPITYVLTGVAERAGDAALETRTIATAEEYSPTTTATAAPDAVPFTPVEKLAPTPRAEMNGHMVDHTVSPASFVTRTSRGSSPAWFGLAPWFVALYAAGVIIMLARLVVAIMKANRIVAHAEIVTDGPLVDTLRSLAGQWSMKVIPALARAERIVVPTVIGFARPTVLLPLSAIGGLSADELEMILAHELAHVRRHDMWISLVQRLAEAALFFNPALWYVSRRISTLREYCCDEMTCRVRSASASEPRVRYAAALLRVVELAEPHGTTRGAFASLAATGRPPSEVRRRIARLFGEPLGEPLRV